jgi:hypothetical protein
LGNVGQLFFIIDVRLADRRAASGGWQLRHRFAGSSDVAGESEGESTNGSSVCPCCGALSGFATGSSPTLSICLRLAMALVLDWAFINR